ncbi:MAG: T9SS type B sorting domain-containing protein, partial [Pedobacter sp.]
SLDAILRRASTTSPGYYRWAYSVNGTTFTEIGTEDIFISRTAADNNNGEVQPSIDLSAIAALQYVPSTTVITLRLYAWGGTDIVSSSNFGIGKFNASTPSLAFKGSVVNVLPPSYTVTFDAKGGTSVSSVTQYQNLKINAPTNPTKVDYNFGGWYKDENYTTKWDFNVDVVQSNTTLYAKWIDSKQIITFPAIADKRYGDTFDLSATTNSGLPITYEALTNNITINGFTVTINNIGLATIRATQNGDASFDPAPPVEVSFNIEKGLQVLTLDQKGPYSRYAGPISLTASSNIGLPVIISANEPTVAVITSDNKLIIKGLGTVKVTVSQAGNELYAATELSRDILIHTAGSAQLLVTQALSPNGDGINDVFIVEGIKAYPENQVKIVNRSGNLVYEQKGYDNEKFAFSGKSKGGDKLPDGTYYYSIEYKKNDQWVQKKGYLFLKN